VQSLLLEYQRVALELANDAVAGGKISPQDLLGKWILYLRLNGPFQRTSSINP
jgi:hypothetical protein